PCGALRFRPRTIRDPGKTLLVLEPDPCRALLVWRTLGEFSRLGSNRAAHPCFCYSFPNQQETGQKSTRLSSINHLAPGERPFRDRCHHASTLVSQRVYSSPMRHCDHFRPAWRGVVNGFLRFKSQINYLTRGNSYYIILS